MQVADYLKINEEIPLCLLAMEAKVSTYIRVWCDIARAQQMGRHAGR